MMRCHFCRGPISEDDLEDNSIAVVMSEDEKGKVTKAAHREPCYGDEMRWQQAEELRDAQREDFR